MTEAKAAALVASTVNDQLLDRAIRHQIYIQQYGAGVAEDIVKELVQAEQELLGKVAARLVKAEKIGFDRGPWTTKRLSTITAGLGEIVDNKYSATYNDMLKPKMLELAKAEANFTTAGFDSTVPVKLEYELPSPEMLRSMVLSEPFEGAVMGSWWKGVATGEKEKIQRALRQGLVQGETTPQIVRRLTGPKGVLAISHHHATAVIRTATNHVSSGARAQTYQQNSKYIKSERIVATLDARTSEICRFQDGRIYPVGEGPRPPFHFNCRTTVVAVLKSWKELGIPLKEAPPGTRASMNGQVPADLTYKQWFKAQPASFQKELLGPNRYKMFAAGLEDVTKYATPAGKLYTLKQLYARHPDVALKANLIEPGQASTALKRQATKQFDKALDSAVKSLKVPAVASDYPSFLSAYKAAKATISEAAVKAQANGVLAGAKTFSAFDKLKDISKVYKAQIETDNTAKQLQDIAKVTGIKKWQWSTKDNLSTLMTSLDDDLIAAATTQMNDKWLAWKAKQAANQAAKKADAIAIKNATEAVAEIQDSVQLPDSPASWESFKESIEIGQKKKTQLIVDMTQAKVSTDKINEIINPLDLALKTNEDAFKSMVSALKAKELATLAKDTGIKKWQWTTKDEFITLMTSTDASELADVAKSVEAKWLGWKAQQKANQDAKKVIKDKLKADAKELQAAIKAAGGKGLLKDIKVYLGTLESTDDALVGDFATATWKVTDPAAIKDKLKSMGYKWQNMPEDAPAIPPAAAAAPLPSPAATPPPAPVAATAASEPALAATAAKPKPTAGWTAADDAWEQISPDDFKYLGDASAMGGAHSKDFYELDGEKWLFKPVSKGGWAGGDEFIARGEEAVYKLQRLIDPQTPEVRFIELNGRPGSIQRILPDIDKDFNGIFPRQLSADIIEQFQREHVLDWLVSNHDGHWKQFLLDRDGHVYGIDKGQAYKFLDSDTLDLRYAPNSHVGEREPYYNEIFRAAKAGEVSFDPQATLKYIERIEALDDSTFREILRPYAEGRFAKKTEVDRFLDLALDRKHNLRSDFRDYYRNVTNDPDFDWEVQPSQIGVVEGRIIDGVESRGWQGQTIPFDGEDIEDQNLLLFVDTKGSGKNRQVFTNASMRVRPQADDKIIAFIKRNGGETDSLSEPQKASNRPATKKKGEPLPADTFFEPIEAAIKTVNVHVNDGDFNFNAATLLKAKNLRQKLTEIVSSDVFDIDYPQMASYYLKLLDEIDKAVVAKTTISAPGGGHYKQYVASTNAGFSDLPVEAKITAGPTPVSGLSVAKGEATYRARTIRESGELGTTEERKSKKNLFGGDSAQYTLKYPDGTEIHYRPWSDSNPYAVRGDLEIVIPERPSSAVLEDLIKKLDEMGIDARIATVDDTELMYLMKQAYVSRKDETSGWISMMNGLDARNATTTERVAALREYWQKELGIDDLSKSSEYVPEGWYTPSHMLWKKGDRGFAGNRQQYRFDIPEDFDAADMDDYVLWHDVEFGGSNIMEDFFRSGIIEKNGHLISTKEKFRMGIGTGAGDSVAQDLRTGGAAYAFTRIQKADKARNLVGITFKLRNLRRMDAISYEEDLYGDVGGDKGQDVVRNRRASGISDWKNFANSAGNETIFKGGLSIIEEVDQIMVRTAADRQEVIDLFRKAGITVLPDGRKVTEIVKHKGQ